MASNKGRLAEEGRSLNDEKYNWCLYIAGAWTMDKRERAVAFKFP